MPMGVLAPGSAHTRPFAQPPIEVSENIPAHMSAESPSNISPNPSEVISEVSEPKDNFRNYPSCPPKSVIVQGVGWVPNFFIYWNPNIFVT